MWFAAEFMVQVQNMGNTSVSSLRVFVPPGEMRL